MSNKVQESVQNAQNGGQNPQVSNPVINGKKKKKGSTNQDLRERIKEITAQMSGLQEQVAELERRAKYITPEMEDLIELYRDTERYSERCYQATEKQIRRLHTHCEDDISEAVFESYQNKFGSIIREMENMIEKDLAGLLLDNVSIYWGK